jgi:hypothetical protein
MFEFFGNFGAGALELLAWIISIWPLWVIGWLVVSLFALMRAGKGLIAAGLMLIAAVPIASLALQVGVYSGGKGIAAVENTYMPTARAEADSVNIAMTGVEDVQTKGICGIAPSFCEKADANTGSGGGGPTPAGNSGGGGPTPAGNSGSTVATPIPPPPPIKVLVPLEGEELRVCVLTQYPELRIIEKLPAGGWPYDVRIDGTIPAKTDWAHTSTQILMIKVTQGSNHWRLYNPHWQGWVQIDERKVAKGWWELGSEVEKSTAEELIAGMGGLEIKAAKAWLIQGTGDWPHQCYREEVVGGEPAAEEPPAAEQPAAEPTATAEPALVQLTCDFPGQETAGTNLYGWIGSVPTGLIGELNPELNISPEGENLEVISGIVWPDGYDCP